MEELKRIEIRNIVVREKETKEGSKNDKKVNN